MNALNSILGPDSPNAVRFAVIFLIVALGVFVLWFVISSIMKALRRGGLVGRSRQPRLGILEETEIDARRRLLLIRRDNVEHLILLGQNGDIVIEQNITRVLQANVPPQPSIAQPPLREANAEDEGVRNNYRVAAKNQARLAAQVQARPIETKPIETKPEEPVVVAPPAPQVNSAPPINSAPAMSAAPAMNMGQFSRPNPFPQNPARVMPQLMQPASSVVAAPVNSQSVSPAPQPVAPAAPAPIQAKPAVSPFDNLENEMANLLGQTRPVKAP